MLSVQALAQTQKAVFFIGNYNKNMNISNNAYG